MAAQVRNEKLLRHRKIVQLLRSRDVESQSDLAKILARSGDSVTQATLSRDLEELGAFKTRGSNGQVVYRVPDEPPVSHDWLERMLQEFALEVDSSANTCVIKTPPGGASAVARALDNAAFHEILGTIAGDDTVLCIAREGASGKTLCRKLRSMAGHTTTMRKGS
ncbi:MAG: arginine repressor [Actinomycetota bacterium]